MPVHLEAATLGDLATVLGWTPEAAALARWAGPVRYPPTPASFREDAGVTHGNSFILRDETGSLVAFGQALPRPEGTVHLARLIVAPAARGRGWGRELCRRLMAATPGQAPRRFTLNVYADNLVAVRLYTSLGFAVASRDLAQGSLAMVRPAGSGVEQVTA